MMEKTWGRLPPFSPIIPGWFLCTQLVLLAQIHIFRYTKSLSINIHTRAAQTQINVHSLDWWEKSSENCCQIQTIAITSTKEVQTDKRKRKDRRKPISIQQLTPLTSHTHSCRYARPHLYPLSQEASAQGEEQSHPHWPLTSWIYKFSPQQRLHFLWHWCFPHSCFLSALLRSQAEVCTLQMTNILEPHNIQGLKKKLSKKLSKINKILKKRKKNLQLTIPPSERNPTTKHQEHCHNILLQ